MSDQLVAETSTWRHTTLTTDKYPCPGGIRTRSLSRRAAEDLHLRPRGHWDQPWDILAYFNTNHYENTASSTHRPNFSAVKNVHFVYCNRHRNLALRGQNIEFLMLIHAVALRCTRYYTSDRRLTCVKTKQTSPSQRWIFTRIGRGASNDRTVIIFQFKRLMPPLRESCYGGVQKMGQF